jgi:CRP-like cAMP-binding protein
MVGLETIALFEPLGAAACASITTRCRRARYEPNQLVIDYDDPSTEVHFVLSGCVRVLYRTPSGKETILSEIKAGHFFGELAAIDGRPRSANVTALHRSELAIMPAAAFNELLDQHPALSRFLLRLFTGRIRALNKRLAEHSFLQAKPRLYCELLRLSQPRVGRGDERAIAPPPLQHDLAARIGARREVVSRELAALTRDGLVERTRGALVLKNSDELNRRISIAMKT